MTIYKSKSGDCGTFFEIEFTLRRIFCAMPRALLFQYCVWHAYQIPPRPKTILSMGGSNKFTWEQEKLEQLRERGGYLQLKPPSSLACWYIRPRWYPRPGMISYDVWISRDMYIICNDIYGYGYHGLDIMLADISIWVDTQSLTQWRWGWCQVT